MFKIVNVNSVINYNENNDNYEYNRLYYLINDNNIKRIIGYGIIRYDVDDVDNSNISFDIRKNERNKGYGDVFLRLLLNECKKLNMSNVYITSLYKDLYYNKVVTKNGGIPIKGFNNEDGNYNVKYEIKLKNKVKKL